MNFVSGQFIDEVVKVLFHRRTGLCSYDLGRWSLLSAALFEDYEDIMVNCVDRSSTDAFYSVPFRRRVVSNIGITPPNCDNAVLSSEDAVSVLKEALKSANIRTRTHFSIMDTPKSSLGPILHAFPNLYKFFYTLSISSITETTLELLENCTKFGQLEHIHIYYESFSFADLEERLHDAIVGLMSSQCVKSITCVNFPHLPRHVIQKVLNKWLADPDAFGVKCVYVKIQKPDLNGLLKAAHAFEPRIFGRRHPSKIPYTYMHFLHWNEDDVKWDFDNRTHHYGTTKFLLNDDFTF